jgi:hypothetical protein
MNKKFKIVFPDSFLISVSLIPKSDKSGLRLFIESWKSDNPINRGSDSCRKNY